MKFQKSFIFISCLLMFSVCIHQGVDAQENLAQQAYAIFEQSCLNCHGEHGAYTEQLIIDHAALVAPGGAVIPGNPDDSEFYKRLVENRVEKRMPLGQPRLSDAAIDTVRRWILAGAPDWENTFTSAGPFITPKEMLETIENHVNSLAPFDRAFARYFTLTHLYNAGETNEALGAYQRALSKLVNSLSWGRKVTNPRPIDSEETIFYIDLRDYEWEIGINRWTLIEAEYPYEIEFNAPTQTALREKLTNLREAMDCEVPFVHVDWFLATASLPPLYHDILGLPETDRELETRLEVNVVENLRNAAGRRVWRAGFNESGVSNHNRVVERHQFQHGAYWKSYDFAGSVGTQNIFTHPLAFTHDGGEIIFNLPNGLQAYYLADAGGNRLNAAPIAIVRNPAVSDPTVRNGLSCIGCHTEGMKEFEDQVRGVVEQNENPPFDKDRALRLYVEKAEMDAFVAEDTERYRQALEKTGGVFGGIEPVQRFHEAFQRPLDAAHAAASVGLETAVFLQKIRQNTSLQHLGLLVLENGTMKRDTWTSNFDDMISALSTPDSTRPPVVQRPDLIPGASVHIPDANLRAAIVDALGKAPKDSITAAEMATLTQLEINDAGIGDLSGLEFATELEKITLNNNLISDLSPLAKLINLRNIDLSGNPISDLSPLAGLTKMKSLVFSNNEISDLSPLVGLVELTVIFTWGNPISDFSPLAGLVKLAYLDICGAEISDLSFLARLTNLHTLYLRANGISDISLLANLTELTGLGIGKNNISDVSPLAGLTNLEWLRIDKNEISDVSPLAGLTNLKQLNLNENPITDFSPLEELFENTKILFDVTIPDENLRAAIAEALSKAPGTPITIEDMMKLKQLTANGAGIRDLTGLERAINASWFAFERNQISDLSPLVGLENLNGLAMANNQISDLSPLSKLTNLEHLSLYNNPEIADLSPISGLTKLKALHLVGSKNISDISALAGLVNLKSFTIWGSPISDLSPLSGLTQLERLDICGSKASDISVIAKLTELKELYLALNGISDVSPLRNLIGLTRLSIAENKVSDVAPLASLINLKWLALQRNSISDLSALGVLSKTTKIVWHENPGYPKGGPKIEGPWLWVTVQGKRLEENIDSLAQASGGIVTEKKIATQGATEGTTVGKSIWRSQKISQGLDNIGNMLRSLGVEPPTPRPADYHVYGVVTLYSTRRQNTTMFAGGATDHKVWLNGELVNENLSGIRAWDYEDFFPVTLKRGMNVLLVAVDNRDGWQWSGFFGFAPGTEYSVSNPRVGYTFSEPKIHAGDTFTLDLSAENVFDLAGWQFDIAFDPAVLEAVEVNEGDFLKTGDGATFFQKGTIDNTTGKITKLSSARLSEDGVSGKGTLLSVTFTAKTAGQTQLKLENFQLAAITGVSIPAGPHEVVITVEGQLATGDVNRDGQVSILDMVLVARHFGKTVPANSEIDMNGDGVVNIQDLIIVAQHLGESTVSAAPSMTAAELNPAMIQAWIAQAQVEDDGSLAFQQGIANLQQLLALLIPEETALLPNYPNPFNPETWIPYQLSEPAEVTLTIHSVNGTLIRTLALGHHRAGIYQTRTRAAYWDGKNEVGESVASGVYFYRLTAGEFSATRKMLIRK